MSPQSETERRQSPRVVLGEIAYINVEPDNGGLILNLSENGLGFQTAEPLQPGEPVRFSFALPGGQQVRAVSEVAWTDATHKTGGLHFTFLSAGARQQIRRWLSRSVGEQDILPAAPVLPTAAEVLDPINPAAPPLPPATPSVTVPLESPSYSGGAYSSQPFMEGSWSEDKVQTGRGIWFILGTVTGILVALVAVVLFFQPDIVSRIHLFGQSREPAVSVQPPAAGPPVASTPSSSPAASPSAPPELPVAPNPPSSPQTPLSAGAKPRGQIAPATPQSSRSRTSASLAAPPLTEARSSSAARANRQEPQPSPSSSSADSDGDYGQSELAAAQRYLRDRSHPQETAALLWSAVRQGNTTAEVLLADLYLHGEGVSRSCEQARVLLTAAARHGNPQAEERLPLVSGGSCS